ncbi:MAG: rod shape-determining protein RodA [Candidatus Pacebacteria bacterium]|nr:rod shape-determining protein RodA [Candidatus Paceibacterota bacterium]
MESFTEHGGPENKGSFFSRIDWTLLFFAVPITIMGLVTMQSYGGGSIFFDRQLAWLAISIAVFFVFALVDVSILKKTSVLVSLFAFCVLLLLILFVVGHTSNGATSWFNFGGFSIQPSDFVKVVLILILAKYFSRRNVAIGEVKHILISASYMIVPFLLIFLEPDFGTAMILGLIWLGMALVAGIRKRHLALLFGLGALIFVILWSFVFAPYQQDRIRTFLNPLRDIHGAGYNARQAMIAVGSGELFGKGIGYGTQSRLRFLPEYQTDFIFAAFAEEWGFIGTLILLLLYAFLLAHILSLALHGASNFETLFASGVMILFISHSVINISMNMGLMPVTGITLPFMSYGGSHLLAEFAMLGILSSMRNYTRRTHPEDLTKEFEGL